MGLFDTPNSGYGIHFNPEFVYTEVDADQLIALKERAKELKISFERWVVRKSGGEVKEVTHLDLRPGKVYYSPEYNCIRGTYCQCDLISFEDFITRLKVHEKNESNISKD